MQHEGEEKKISKLDNLIILFYRENSEDILDEIIAAGRGLVLHFVKIYSGGYPNEDMIQAGYEGLLKAIKNFLPDRGVSFVTYAGCCIMGEIRHYVRKEVSFYRPGCIETLWKSVDDAVEKTFVEKGEIPTLGKISELVNIKEEGIPEVMRAGMVSFDELEISRISSLKYRSFQLPVEDRLVLRHAIGKLNELQQKIIHMLFFRDMTQKQVADSLGLNPRKVSRLLKSCLSNLQNSIIDKNDEPDSYNAKVYE
jgi:RNA polymerase sigma-B factor